VCERNVWSLLRKNDENYIFSKNLNGILTQFGGI
jgi:hypothetical protein